MTGARAKPRSKRSPKRPRCLVIAGPNGAGKTTFAREYLPYDARILRFVNADLIAAGLSPLAPQRAALAAARVMLAEIDRLAEQRVDFAFESTLSGRTYASRLDRLTKSGYHLEIIFLRVASPRLVLQRIAARVKQGGHAVPKTDVFRRYVRGWENFEAVYRPLAHAWSVYDNSGEKPVLLERGP
jgi:predicted ABC-type ATPase